MKEFLVAPLGEGAAPCLHRPFWLSSEERRGPFSDIDLFIVCWQLPKGMLKRHKLFGLVRQRFEGELERLWRKGIYMDFMKLIYTEEARRFRWLYLEMIEEAEILPPRAHDVGPVLKDNLGRFPEAFAEAIPKLASISRSLRAKRESSFNGDERRP